MLLFSKSPVETLLGPPSDRLTVALLMSSFIVYIWVLKTTIVTVMVCFTTRNWKRLEGRDMLCPLHYDLSPQHGKWNLGPKSYSAKEQTNKWMNKLSLTSNNWPVHNPKYLATDFWAPTNIYPQFWNVSPLRYFREILFSFCSFLFLSFFFFLSFSFLFLNSHPNKCDMISLCFYLHFPDA